MYIIKSKKQNKTKLGKLLPNNAPIMVLKLKDFFDKDNRTEAQILKILQNDNEIEITIKEDGKIVNTEDLNLEDLTKKQLVELYQMKTGEKINIQHYKKEEIINMINEYEENRENIEEKDTEEEDE